MTAAPRSLRLLRLTLAGFGSVVVLQAGFGFAGRLRAAPLAIGLVGAALLLALVVRGARHARVADEAPRERWTASDGAGAAALTVGLVSRAWEGVHRTTFMYDVLSYHLHLPASWHALGKLALVPTPFGDQAPAYAPANAELFFELAIAATGNLRLAHLGQLPFAALATLAIYATARGLGARRSVGFGGALAFLLVPEVWQQAAGAMTDLALASFILATLPFLPSLRAPRSGGSWGDVAALGTAMGLALGTKYVGALLLVPIALAVLLPVVLPAATQRPAAVGAARARLGLAATAARLSVGLGLVFLCGGFWYARNLIVAGNPTFPVTLQLGPWTLARGLYGGAAMAAWSYHLPLSDVHPLLEIFSETTLGFLVSAILASVAALRGAQVRWLVMLMGFVGLGWLVVPYQQSRFFFCAWGILALVMIDGATALPPRLRGWLLAPAIAGGALQWPTPARLLVALLAILGALAEAMRAEAPPTSVASAGEGVASAGGRRGPGQALRWGCVAVLLGAAGGAIAWARGHAGHPPYAVGDAHDEAWAFLSRQPPGLRVAYAGSNLPLPLWGPALENFVRYVNVARDLDAPLHDFRSEAIGLPVSAEPAPERAHPDRNAWLANLEAGHIDTVFVAALYPDVRPSMPHDAEAFPSERAWADALPERFALVFANQGVRIYRRRPAAAPAPGVP